MRQGRAGDGRRKQGCERGEVDGLAPDFGQDVTGTRQRAQLDGGEEAFGSVAKGIENSLEARDAVLDAGESIAGEGAGIGLIVLGHVTQSGAGRGDDGKDKMEKGIAATGGGGQDVLSEGVENGHGGYGVRSAWGVGLGLGVG